MIVKEFETEVAVDIEVHRATQVQAAGHAAIDIIKIISCRKAIANLGDELHRCLCKQTDSREEHNR